RADVFVVMGDISTALEADLAGQKAPVMKAVVKVKKSELPGKVIAFCGIGHPEKFFASLEAAGIEVLYQQSFPDHYVYTLEDLAPLKKMATQYKARLVTTKKDWVRLGKKDKEIVVPVPITLEWKTWKDM